MTVGPGDRGGGTDLPAAVRGCPVPDIDGAGSPADPHARLTTWVARCVRTPPMLPYACVCVPVLGVFIAGLFADRRYLGELRSMTEAARPRVPVVAPRPLATESARPAA